MPFSKSNGLHTEEYWTKHFENFLKPGIEELSNIEVHRSAELRSDIIKEIIKDLYLSDFVVADLTDHNPNVFWELGVRQSLNYGTITIAEGGTDLPFDISTKSTLFYYPGDSKKNEKFLQNLREAIKDCIMNPDKSDSTVIDVTTKLKRVELIPDEYESLKREIYQKQDNKFEEFLEPNVHGFYILIGFASIPQNNNEKILDMDDTVDENFVTSIHRYFSIGSPSGRLKAFFKYIRDFKFINGAFKSEYEYILENAYNSSEFDIFSNGNVIGNIIFRTRSGYEIGKSPRYEFDDSKELEYKSSPFIHHKSFPYLTVMFLLLAKLLYKDRYSGNFNFNLRILSSYKISTIIYDYLKLSNDSELEINKLINVSDLDQKDKFLKTLFDVVRDFLRFFGYSLQDIKRFIEIFKEPIESYIDLIFR